MQMADLVPGWGRVPVGPADAEFVQMPVDGIRLNFRIPITPGGDCTWETAAALYRDFGPNGESREGRSTFCFSAGLAGPDRSLTGHLTWSDDVTAHLDAQTEPHVSRAVVSKALARSAAHEWCFR